MGTRRREGASSDSRGGNQCPWGGRLRPPGDPPRPSLRRPPQFPASGLLQQRATSRAGPQAAARGAWGVSAGCKAAKAALAAPAVAGAEVPTRRQCRQKIAIEYLARGMLPPEAGTAMPFGGQPVLRPRPALTARRRRSHIRSECYRPANAAAAIPGPDSTFGAPGMARRQMAALASEREVSMAEHMVREAVGVFHDSASLQRAVDELLVHGFDRSFLSLMATGDTVERELGHRYRRVEEMADDPHAPHVAYVG